MQSTGMNLLAKIVQENRHDEFLKLNKKWFYHDEELKTFSFIENHFKKYGQLPSTDLCKKVKLEVANSKDPFQYFIDEFSNRAIYNELGELLPKLQDILSKNKNTKNVLPLVESFLNESRKIQFDNRTDVLTLGNLGDLVLEHVRTSKYLENGITGIPTGWVTLDNITQGFQKGDVIVIVARPKMGKSLCMTLLADAAHNAGYIPLEVSMEMKALQIARRRFAQRAGLNMNTVKSGQLSYWGEERLKEAINLAKTKHPFYFVEGQFKKDLGEVESLIYGLKPHIVFIDGGYLLRLVYKSNLAKWEIMDEIIKQLKSIASQHDIPVVVSFQFTRQVKKTDTSAGLENIHLSDAIGQIASVAIGIFEDGDTETISASNRRRIEIVGGREGESGGFYINWSWDTMNFDEII